MEIDDLTDDELADLARLADGTLPRERRAEVEARVAASPELTEMVAAQGVTLQALRATADVGAPASLRARVERRPATRPGLGRFLVPVATGLAAAAIVIAVLLALPNSGPSVNDAAAIAQKRPSTGAPARVPGTPQLLAVKVDDVPFPNYKAKFGWTPSGEREDRPSGRHATTVYYKKGGRDIAYTIVSGDALKVPASGGITTRGGVEYTTFKTDGRNVVTWKRRGHTCVLSSRSASSAELVALADWRGTGAIPF
jgi:anti-sigma factor RsiW